METILNEFTNRIVFEKLLNALSISGACFKIVFTIEEHERQPKCSVISPFSFKVCDDYFT